MVENEIQYVPWKQFQQMVPSILGLEITRLSRHLRAENPLTSERNIIVKVRFDIRRFIDCVARVGEQDVQRCAEHLTSALLNAALLPEHPILMYVIDRLKYVRDRMPYIY